MVELVKEQRLEHDIKTTVHRLRDDFLRDLPYQLRTLEALLEEFKAGDKRAGESIRILVIRLLEAVKIHYLPEIRTLVVNFKELFEINFSNLNLGIEGEELPALNDLLNELKMKVDYLSAEWLFFPPSGQSRKLWLLAGEGDAINQQLPVLAQAGFAVETLAGDSAVAQACQGLERPVAVIIGMGCLQNGYLTEASLTGLSQLCLAGLPMLLLLTGDDMAVKLAAVRKFGGANCLTGDVETGVLLQKLAEMIPPLHGQIYHALLLGDNSSLAVALERAGWTVQVSSDPLQASSLLARFPADVLVLPLRMPSCSGAELAAILRGEENYRYLPVVYLVDGEEPIQVLPASGHGIDHYAAKSTDSTALLNRMAGYARQFRHATKKAEDHRLIQYECRRHYQAVNYHAIVSVTDTHGRIIYVNEKFCEVSGYSRDELLGCNHRILKSGKHPDNYFAGMWRTLTRGKIWQGEVCNRRKDGDFYWVKSSIVPFLDNKGVPYQYFSICMDVTKIKEDELRLNILSRAVDSSSGSISIADASDPKLPLIYVNPAFERITGYSREEAVGQNARFLLANDSNQEDLHEVRAALREGREAEALLRNYRKDGSLFWNKMRIAPVHDEKGKLTHFIGITEDVTQQREAEASRQEALERLQKIASRVPGVVFQLRMTPEGRFSMPYASDAFVELFHLDADEVCTDAGKLGDVIHPFDCPRILVSLKISARDLAHWEHEFRVKFADGTVRWLMGDAVPEREEGGSILWHGYVSDISYRKSTERALKESIKQTQAIMDNVIDGVITIDNHGIVSSFNPAAQKIFGYAAHEIVGQNVSQLMPEPHRGRHDDYLKNYSETRIQNIIGKGREVAGRRKDGSIFPMDLAVSELELGDKLLFIGLVRDISERKQHEEQLLIAKNEAECANLAKSKFLSSMSHELRTPMNAVLGFAQLMEMDTQLLAEHREGAREILKAGHHLMELINEILNLSKIESGNIELSIETVVLAEVIDACLALLRPMVEARSIEVVVRDCSSILLRADPLRLKQCLLNLLSNAIKYNKPNGQVTVGYSSLSPGRGRILVGDTGIGIQQELLGELFRPFSRLEAEKLTIQGTGIGLAITRQLVELMGGAIGVESRYGIGSTFWLELPEIKSGDANTQGHPCKRLAKPPILLYVHENISNFKHIIELLNHRPQIQLMTAHTSRIGLELLATVPFDLIMLDINMPQMDGFAFMKELRRRGLNSKIPVIALSSIAGLLDPYRAQAVGFAGYLEKPIEAQLFFSLLDTLLVTEPELMAKDDPASI